MSIHALPFSKLSKTIKRTPVGYPITLTSIGDHIRKRRLELKLLQEDVAEIIDTCLDSITGWESGRSEPQIQFYPKIIELLGYFPWDIETLSLGGGKIKAYRYKNGLNYKKLGSILGKNATTISDWEEAKSKPSQKNEKKLLVLMGL